MMPGSGTGQDLYDRHKFLHFPLLLK
jgi:hypothetical protein